MTTDNYTVTRRFAADILNVSLRTLDRQVRKGNISSMRRGRELFFNESNLLQFKARILAKEQYEQMQSLKASRGAKDNFQGRQKQTNQKTREFVDVQEAQVMEQSRVEEEDLDLSGGYDELDAGFAKIRDNMLRRSPEERIYKALHAKTEEELKVTRQKLELANYKIGTLESQVNSMVPLIEFRRQKQELLALAEESRCKDKDIVGLENQVKIEQFVKKAYAVFLFFMMIIIPLLVILRLFS